MGIDTSYDITKDPSFFYVNLMINNGWVMNVTLNYEEGILPTQKCWLAMTIIPLGVKHI